MSEVSPALSFIAQCYSVGRCLHPSAFKSLARLDWFKLVLAPTNGCLVTVSLSSSYFCFEDECNFKGTTENADNSP